jgi:hypothetical protein
VPFQLDHLGVVYLQMHPQGELRNDKLQELWYFKYRKIEFK